MASAPGPRPPARPAAGGAPTWGPCASALAATATNPTTVTAPIHVRRLLRSLQCVVCGHQVYATIHRMRRRRAIAFWLVALAWAAPALAQDERADYPAWLAHAFVEFSAGGIGYPFSFLQLEDGFTAESVQVPKLAARLTLGHRFNDRTSVGTDLILRPARWVAYRNVNAVNGSQSVWMNVIGGAVRHHVPLARAVSIYGEAGHRDGDATRHHARRHHCRRRCGLSEPAPGRGRRISPQRRVGHPACRGVHARPLEPALSRTPR